MNCCIVCNVELTSEVTIKEGYCWVCLRLKKSLEVDIKGDVNAYSQYKEFEN